MAVEGEREDSIVSHIREQFEAGDAQNAEAVGKLAQKLQALDSTEADSRAQIAMLMKLLISTNLDVLRIAAMVTANEAEYTRLYFHDDLHEVSSARKRYLNAVSEALMRANAVILDPNRPVSEALLAYTEASAQFSQLRDAADLWGRSAKR